MAAGRGMFLIFKSFVAYFKSLKNVDLNKNFGKEVNAYLTGEKDDELEKS